MAKLLTSAEEVLDDAEEFAPEIEEINEWVQNEAAAHHMTETRIWFIIIVLLLLSALASSLGVQLGVLAPSGTL